MEISDNSDNSDNFEKEKPCTTYGQTVLASTDGLARLPTEIYQIWEQYQGGELPSCSPEEVKELLTYWSKGDTSSILHPSPHGGICELSTDPSPAHTRLLSSRISKRRRINSNL